MREDNEDKTRQDKFNFTLIWFTTKALAINLLFDK